MVRLKDARRTVEIEMMAWNGSGYNPDWSAEFFEVGCLRHDEEKDAYRVEDVGYCISEARDWEKGDENYFVFVNEA